MINKILKKNDINIEVLVFILKIFYEINKTDKKVSILSNSNDKVLESKNKKKKKKKKNKKVIEPDSPSNNKIESQNITNTINTDINSIINENIFYKGNRISKYSMFIRYLFQKCLVPVNFPLFKLYETLYYAICTVMNIEEVYDDIEINSKDFERIIDITSERYNQRYILLYDPDLPEGIPTMNKPLNKNNKLIVINLILLLKYAKDHILHNIDNSDKINNIINKYLENIKIE